jgi:polyferredoxin
MAKKMYAAFASCVAVVLALAFAELPSTFAIHEQDQHQEHRQAEKRRDRPERQKKARKKAKRTRVTYVCPMHSDIRSNSQGTCPKCLMDLVAERR